jgi:NADH-quinone oxidoreductase subunit H
MNSLTQNSLSLTQNSTVVTFFSETLGVNFSTIGIYLVYFIATFILVNIAALIGGLGTYAERKISADMQARMGPNRVGPYGLFQVIADGLKMLMKEDTIPNTADRFLYHLAPLLCIIGIFSALAVFPVSSGLALSHLNAGVIYLVAISSLVGLGVFLGGYSSNSKWSMLGGMRGASQIISYEIPVTLTLITIVLMAGSASFEVITNSQKSGLSSWYLFHNPFTFIGFFVYFISALAESNRAPFDLPEAESELVSGYHTEFSGMKFAFFALAEYVEVFVLCGVASALFLGGYNVPFGIDVFLTESLKSPFPAQILQLLIFFSKTLFLYYFVIVIRWTLPRLRVDQLMTVCWKYLTPIALFNLVGCAVWIYFFHGKTMTELLIGLMSMGSSSH